MITGDHTPRPGRSGGSIIAVLIALALLATGPAAAMAGPAERNPFAQRVDLAGAAWISETETTLTDLSIQVFHLSERSLFSGPLNYRDPGIVLFYVSRHTDPETGAITETNYEGFSGGPTASLSFRRSLAGAHSAFSIELWGYRCVYPPDPGGGPDGISPTEVTCDDIGSVMVDGEITWTGVGDIFRDATNSRAGEPPLAMWGAHTLVVARDAVAEGVIAGGGTVLARGEAAVGILLRGKHHEQTVIPRPAP